MARPLKVGIDYFPTDVDIDQDDKVKMVKNKYGLMGMGTVLMLLAKVYKNGYFYHWTEREQELFCGDYREEVNVVNNVVNECIKWGLFDKNVYEHHQVLTSSGIQKRYLLAVERRKDKHIIDEYWLIEKDVNESKNIVNVNNNSINESKKAVNADKSTQSKVNKTKLKEIKKEYAHNVSLTEHEYKRLCEEYGETFTLSSIEYLSSYKMEKGYKTKSDNLTIRRWVMDAMKKGGGKNGKFEKGSQGTQHGGNKSESQFAFLDINKPASEYELDPEII